MKSTAEARRRAVAGSSPAFPNRATSSRRTAEKSWWQQRKSKPPRDPRLAHAGIEMRPSKRSLADQQGQIRENNMRSFLLIASAIVAFAATMTIETTDANAVVCARGVYRAGCAGYRGAVVVCRRVLVNGVWVRRCV